MFLIFVVVHHGAPPVGTRTRTGRDSSSSQQNDAAGIRRRRRVAELTGAGVRVVGACAHIDAGVRVAIVDVRGTIHAHARRRGDRANRRRRCRERRWGQSHCGRWRNLVHAVRDCKLGSGRGRQDRLRAGRPRSPVPPHLHRNAVGQAFPRRAVAQRRRGELEVQPRAQPACNRRREREGASIAGKHAQRQART